MEDQIQQKKKKSTLIDGPIPYDLILKIISHHQHETSVGAQQIFLGQVRADETEEGVVSAIEYTCYDLMAEQAIQKITEELKQKYNLSCLHVLHSKGVVPAGGISLFVMTASKHRKNATTACQEAVERIKTGVPVWGKELSGPSKYKWKEIS
jgi:molybdopterin synthase catalytic subunit